MRTETIRIDLNQVSHRSITLKQGDTTTLVLDVSALSKPYELAGLTPVLVGLRSDGYLVIQTTKITVKGNILTVKLDPKFVEIVNELNMELELYNATNEKVSSYTIRTNVAESIGKIDAPVASEDVSDNIGQAISKAVEATNALKNQTDAADEVAENIETYLTDIEAARTQVAQNAVKAADSESKALKSANDAYKSQQSAETAEGKVTTMHNTVVTSAAQVAADKTAVEIAKTQVDANASQISAAVEHLKLIDDKANTILGETAVAETLEITGTADAPFRELHIYGASSQISTKGINLFDMERWRQFLTAGDTTPATPTTWEDDGQYKFLRINGSGTYTLRFMQGEFEPNTQYTLRYMGKQEALPVGNVIGIRVTYTDDEAATPYYVPVDALDWTQLVVTTAAGKTVDHIRLTFTRNGYVDFADVMLVKGAYTDDTMPAYEPYTGGVPAPSPEYPRQIVTDSDYNITLTGKNLFDNDLTRKMPGVTISDAVKPAYNADVNTWEIKTYSSAHSAYGFLVYLEQDRDYTISFFRESGASNNLSVSLRRYIEGAANIYTASVTKSGKTSISYGGAKITESGAYFVLMTNSGAKPTVNNRLRNIQFELGDTATAHEPYHPPRVTPVEMQLYAIPNDAGGWVARDEIQIRAGKVSHVRMIDQSKLDPAVSIVNQSVALRTSPIITDITDTETGQALLKLHTYKGTTTITTDAVPAVGLSAVYNADTKSYIDKKFDELAELIHNLA